MLDEWLAQWERGVEDYDHLDDNREVLRKRTKQA